MVTLLSKNDSKVSKNHVPEVVFFIFFYSSPHLSPSLLSLKVLLSIILVGVSYYYKATPTEENEEVEQENICPTPTKTKLEEFEGKELRRRTGSSKSTKTKTLSEIERYTLCSNRIV